MSAGRDSIGERTIRDFGEQWTHYGDNEGSTARRSCLPTFIDPLLSLSELRELRIAEIGSGAAGSSP